MTVWKWYIIYFSVDANVYVYWYILIITMGAFHSQLLSHVRFYFIHRYATSRNRLIIRSNPTVCVKIKAIYFNGNYGVRKNCKLIYCNILCIKSVFYTDLYARNENDWPSMTVSWYHRPALYVTIMLTRDSSDTSKRPYSVFRATRLVDVRARLKSAKTRFIASSVIVILGKLRRSDLPAER